MEINTVANTSEFFFNGISFGTLNHGTTPGTTLGRVRIDRNDRPTAAADRVQFDQLAVGPIDGSPLRLEFSRLGDELVLNWSAVRRAPRLESTPQLLPPVTWTPADPTTVTGGEFIHRATIIPPSRFFRLRRP